MAINKELLGPQSEGEKEAFAIEALVFSVQIALQKAMQKNGVTNKELAERLGMSPARVSQVFSSNGPNLTLKTIA
ncbi:MAG: helix-turn-helix domain-containing protein, partial [Alphaproteobacteria bacterium]